MVGISSHCPQADERYKVVVIASEPLSNEEWREVPEGPVIGVNPMLETIRRDLVGESRVHRTNAGVIDLTGNNRPRPADGSISPSHPRLHGVEPLDHTAKSSTG